MNISDINRRLGTLSLINFSRKHAELLGAHPSSAISARAAVVLTSVHNLELAYGIRRPMRALWSNATNLKNAADDDLDDYIRCISYDLLAPALLKGNRDAVEYRALFPDGNIEFICAPVRVELVHVSGMVTYLENNPSHPMSSRAGTLKTKAAALGATLEPQTQAEQTYKNTMDIEREKRDELRRVLRKSVTFLRDQLDGDEAKVDDLFPTIAESMVNEDEDEDEDEDKQDTVQGDASGGGDQGKVK